MSNHEYPVIIVGAGPAGCLASVVLTEKKIRHLLIDKSTFPRDKICGDAISGKMMDVLHKLKPGELKKYAFEVAASYHTYGIEFYAPNGKSVGIPFPNLSAELPIGIVSKRIDFDNFLFNLTPSEYCDTLTGTSVTNVTKKGNEVFIETDKGEYKTHLVIAADGSRSIVKKKLQGDEVDEKHYCAAIRVYYKNIAPPKHKDYLEIFCFKELIPGYFWIFPLPDGRANVGLGMLSADISKRKINLKKELQNLVDNHPLLKERFKNAVPEETPKGWGLPLGSKKRVLSGDNFLLTGDAASLIDPFTGEGIGNAGISGVLAGEMAAEALYAKNFSAAYLGKYDERVYDKVWDELKLSHRIQRLTTYPRLFNFLINKISGSKKLQDVFTNMFVDLDLREELKNPLFYFKLLLGK